MKHREIENIIFDLGGVIINLDIDQTFRKFSEIFNKDLTSEVFADHQHYRFFRDYELGKINDSEFRTCISDLAGFPIPDHEIDDAWNAMLRDIPTDRMKWIHNATKKYNCVVLSNTNSIHVRHFDDVFHQSNPHGYPKDFFMNLYYSFEIGERKPDPESFEYVLHDAGFDPVKTILYDDLKENLDTATRLGLQTVYVERNHLRKEQLPDGRI